MARREEGLLFVWLGYNINMHADATESVTGIERRNQFTINRFFFLTLTMMHKIRRIPPTKGSFIHVIKLHV